MSVGICLGFFTFASVSILQEAYVPPKSDYKTAAFSLGIISIANLVLGVTLDLDRIQMKDGVLEYFPMNLMLGITLFLLFILLIIKQYVVSLSAEE